MGRGKSKAGSNDNAIKRASKGIISPTTKDDYINRAKFIAEVSSYGGDEYVVSTSEWAKGDKDRTYISMAKYRNEKYSAKVDMGYYDNNAKQYVKGYNKNGNLAEENLWNMAGSKKFTLDEVTEIIKKKK